MTSGKFYHYECKKVTHVTVHFAVAFYLFGEIWRPEQFHGMGWYVSCCYVPENHAMLQILMILVQKT